jgi:hypothetical protein
LTSELEKEIEKKWGKPAKPNNKSPMKIDNHYDIVKKELSNGHLKEKSKNGYCNLDNKREHLTSISIPPNNTSVKQVTTFGLSDDSSLKNVTSIAHLPSNSSLKKVKLGEDVGNNKRENVTVKEIAKEVKQKTGTTCTVC